MIDSPSVPLVAGASSPWEGLKSRPAFVAHVQLLRSPGGRAII
jgi:hypothetical protein